MFYLVGKKVDCRMGHWYTEDTEHLQSFV